ncbi:MAG: hypothetical protein AVDCRST_MAG31-1299, partial [uncultured Sphingomonas sp.]
ALQIATPARFRAAPWRARDGCAAGRPDGAQCLCDRRHDPGAARDRRPARRRGREPSPAGGGRLHLRLRLRPTGVGPACRPLWPQAGAGDRHCALHAVRRPVLDCSELRAAGGRPRAPGRVGRGDPRAGGGDGPRPVRGRGDGPGDEPGVYGVHAGAGAGAERRPGDPDRWPMAGDLLGACGLRPADGSVELPAAAGNAASRVPADAPHHRTRGRGPRGAERAAVAGLYACADRHLRRPGRLHCVHPADRVRRLPPARRDRLGIRRGRSAHGAGQLAQQPAGRPPRAAPDRASGRAGLCGPDAGPCAAGNGVRGEPGRVRGAAGTGDGELRLYLLQPQHAGDGEDGADRRHGVVHPGRGRHGGRCSRGLHDRPAVRRNPAAVPVGLRWMRPGRSRAGGVDGAPTLVRAAGASRVRTGQSRPGGI